METLTISNESGSSYKFRNHGWAVYVEATNKVGKVYVFKVEAIEDDAIVTQAARLPITTGLKDIQKFMSEAKTRTLIEFDTHEEIMDFFRSDEGIKTGRAFERNGKHCVYVYDNN